MAKCEVIALSSDSDCDFTQTNLESHPSVSVSNFYRLHQVSVHQISITSSSYYNGICACT